MYRFDAGGFCQDKLAMPTIGKSWFPDEVFVLCGPHATGDEDDVEEV
jgi:hypothetical protein